MLTGWRQPQDIPPGPGNLPGAFRNRVPVAGVPGTAGAAFVNVREVNRYPLVTTLSLALTPTPALAVAQPDGTRILLVIRNALTSANNALIAFGQNPLTLASFELVPGAVLLLDYVVPQDDVNVAVATGTAQIVVTYAHVNP